MMAHGRGKLLGGRFSSRRIGLGVLQSADVSNNRPAVSHRDERPIGSHQPRAVSDGVENVPIRAVVGIFGIGQLRRKEIPVSHSDPIFGSNAGAISAVAMARSAVNIEAFGAATDQSWL